MLARLHSRPAPSRRLLSRRPAGFQLASEVLELRCVPAVVVEMGIDLDGDGQNDDLRITGGGENTYVKILDSGDGAGQMQLWVDKNGDGVYANGDLYGEFLAIPDDTCVIQIDLGGGKDVFYYDNIGTLHQSVRTWEIDLGGGNDYLIFGQIYGIEQSLIHLKIDAGSGNDFVGIGSWGASSSTLNYSAVMGNGADHLQFGTSGYSSIDQNAVINADFDMGSGKNWVELWIRFDAGLLTRGNVNVDLLCGNQADEVTVNMRTRAGNGVQASSILVNFNLQGGNDVVNADLFGVDVRPGSTVEFNVQTGSGNDTVTFDTALKSTGYIAGLFKVDILAGAGADSLSAVLFDDVDFDCLLTGVLETHLDGSEGHDQLTLSARADGSGAKAAMDLVVLAGAGNDSVTFGPLLGSGYQLKPAGKALVHGGDGTDTLTSLVPANLIDALLFELFQ